MSGNLKSNIPRIVEEAERRARQAVDQAGEAIEFLAQANAPVDEGDLRAGIKYRSGKGKNPAGRVVSKDHKTKWHEYGTVNMPARPFLRPAVDDVQGKFVDDMGDAYK